MHRSTTCTILLKDTTSKAYRGKTLSDIADYIENGTLAIRQYATTLIHVGTNDISNLMQHNTTVDAEHTLVLYDFSFLQRRQPSDVVQGFIALVNLIRHYNMHAIIIFSHARSDSII